MKKYPNKINCLALVFGLFLFAGNLPSVFAELIINGGFETPLTGSDWNTSNGGARLDPFNNPPVGEGYAGQYAEGNFVLTLRAAQFTFQVRSGVKEGDFVTLTSLAVSSIVSNGTDGGRICIEFKKAALGITEGSLLRRTCSGLIDDATAPPGGNYQRFTVSDTAPAETEYVVFLLKVDSGPARSVLFDDVSAEVNPANFSAAVSKTHVKPGEVVTMFMKFTNNYGGSQSAFNSNPGIDDAPDSFTGVEIVSQLPAGFTLLPESVRVNGRQVRHREGSIVIPVGTVLSGQTITAAYQLIVTTAVSSGKNYSFVTQIRNAANTLSEKSVVEVQVVSDPLFEEGTILGKVFNDKNKNGVQDKGEIGVPGVRLATEQGVVVLTDENGMYSIPAVSEGRHVVKIDAHSLPEGTQFITEETYLVKTTPGILNKASFAVYIPESEMPQDFGEELKVMVTQGLDTSHPVLGVNMEPSVLKLSVGKLLQDATFRFALNYAEFASTWYLEIRDEQGKEVWTGFGIGAPPSEVVWSGQRENGLLISEGLYSYQLKVEDKDKHQDWSPLYFFRVVPANVTKIEEAKIPEIPPIGDFNLFKDGKQTIPLVAKPTIRVHGSTKPGYKVFVNDYPVNISSEGRFETEIYTSPGEKEIHVRATSPQGESVNFDKKVKVKDSTFFMAGLAEGQAGVSFTNGNKESTGTATGFRDGIYEDGRAAYYLKGKLKGKFLIKSRYDTGNKQQALFTNLDPESYYPVYGDASKRTYDAETQQRFYVLVEMERSFAQWGSFKTAFTDTELATYTRTLSGLKVHYETKSSTAYGDPKRGFTAFSARSESRAGHNEFASTGGAEYFLRNRLVIQGSEKVRVEVRDKIQDMPIFSTDLTPADYEMDYEQGRLKLHKPIPMYSTSDVNGTNELAGGNLNYIVVDYEYDPGFSAYDPQNRGMRGFVHLGNHVRVGATALEEKRDDKDYDLRGVDAQFKFGRNTKLKAEYAESKLQQTDNSVSYNGGLSFADTNIIQARDTRPRGSAYLFKGESKPVKNFEMSGYLQGDAPNFSSSNSMSQQAQKKYGVAAKYKLTDHLYARYRYDYNELSDKLKPFGENDVYGVFDNRFTHTLQTIYDNNEWHGELEYLRQELSFPPDHLLPTFYSESPFQSAISAKLGYHLNEELLPYVKVQTTVEGDKPNHQFGGGFRYRLANGFYANLEQMIGNIGDSTLFGFEKYNPNGVRQYANLKAWDYGTGIQSLTSTIGSSYSLSPKSRIYSERQYSNYSTFGNTHADIFGNDTKLNDHWTFHGRLERRHLDPSTFKRLDQQAGRSLLRSNNFSTASGGFTYHPSKRVRFKTYLEGRFDSDSPDLWQAVSRNQLDIKLNKDLTFKTKLDYGKTHFTDPGDTVADFMEFNTGFAYRPIENDRLQILARYTYLRNIGNDLQFDTPTFLGMEVDERAHIWATDVSYDVNKYFAVVEKLAYKTAIFDTSVSDQAIVGTLLWAHRFNFHVTRKWDVALEFRALWQGHDADSLKYGPLVEIDRELYDYIRLGVGYNFTDFSDDLRASNKVSSHGPFVRLTGKF